nr:PREDICTED: serine carboxypeptidase-like 51 isoform X4 [Musa acuminata subsp. malaccensis]
MPISPLLLLLLLFFSSSLSLLLVDAARTADGSEEWGYVQVRPRAHMFWWLYRSPQRVDNGSAPWPTVLWLQGGPGGSGVGIGNFQEIGPVDANLQPRCTTWLQKADLLFVDNPVGTGYSFVEDESLFVKSDWEAAADLTTLLKNLYHEQASSWQNSPLFIVAESYGGKFAVTAGLSIAQAIRVGELKLNLGGVALGDSWISPEDFVLSWAPLLLDLSRIDIIDAEKSSIMAEKIREEIKKEQYSDATNSWGELEEFIVTSSNDVDFYNFLLDSGSDPVSLTAAAEASRKLSLKMYPTYLSSKASTSPDISGLMNGLIKEKLKIIPKNVRYVISFYDRFRGKQTINSLGLSLLNSWGGQSGLVFDSLSNDFMKPRINEVDELLSLGINVTIYNGQGRSSTSSDA